jgi:hypothetical protein
MLHGYQTFFTRARISLLGFLINIIEHLYYLIYKFKNLKLTKGPFAYSNTFAGMFRFSILLEYRHGTPSDQRQRAELQDEVEKGAL